MAIIDLDYVQSLPTPDFLRTLEAAVAETDMVNAVSAEVPTWSSDVQDPLRRAIKGLALQLKVHRDTDNNQYLQGFLPWAEGTNLDYVAYVLTGLRRKTDELDETYRRRASNYSPPVVGTLAGVRRMIDEYEAVDIVDRQVVSASNNQDVTVYVVKAGPTLLTTGESNALSTYLNDDEEGRVLMGRTVNVTPVTLSAFTATLTISYSTIDITQATLQGRVEAQLTQWLSDNQKLGKAVYNSSIIGAIVDNTKAVDATVTTSPSSLVAVVGRAYTAALTDFTITYTAV